MIGDLDIVLRRLLADNVPGIVSDLQVRFEPPNASWRDYVSDLSDNGAPELGLNVYLVDLREHRELRTNERDHTFVNGYALEERAPTRVECHYVISAWDSAPHSVQVQPTPAEHALLSDALAVLLENEPINADRVLSGAPLAGLDPLIQHADLPTEIVPPSGFTKLAEFWGAMGTTIPWRPVVYLIVTIPIARRPRFGGPMVTTLLTDFEPGERLVAIGGHVRDGDGDPIPGAWVRLETPAGVAVQTAGTNGLGRFTFVGLSPEQYLLRARAPGLQEQSRQITVPEPSGEYDIGLPV